MPEKSSKTLPKVRHELRRDRDTIARAQERMTANLRLGIELGGAAPDLAADSGYTVGRVSQIVGGVRKAREAAGVAAPKRKKGAKPEPADPAAAEPEPAPTPVPPALSGIAAAVAALPAPSPEPHLPEHYRATGSRVGPELLARDDRGRVIVSDRYGPADAERPTVFLDVESGEWWSPAAKHGHIPWREGSAAELLAGLATGPLSVVERVFITGTRRPGVTPFTMRRHGSAADAARAWFLSSVPDGWAAAGHYLEDDAALVGRWAHGERKVEVQRAAGWFGEHAYTPRDAAFAWDLLRREVVKEWPGAVLMSTPATTGRALWRRGLPDKEGAGFPVLSSELRELIQQTSGQGRRELFARPADVPDVATVVQYDMRLAYAALAWGMPVGAPTMVTHSAWDAMTDDEQTRALARRGRWLVSAVVPSDWEHVGILPTPNPDGSWAWPSTPRTRVTSWCSASELAIARQQGWRVDVISGFHFDEGKPLNTWKDKLVSIYERERPDRPPVVSKCVRNAARMMILATVGAFASRTHPITRSVPATADAVLPAEYPIREVAGHYTWEEPGERSPWMERVSHPEWSAEIWARCRTRLLSTRTAVPGISTGALHVPPGTVIGMRTDGLTLLGDPGWPDNGRPGQYRVTGRITGAFQWPASDGALSELKRAAEGAWETGTFQ